MFGGVLFFFGLVVTVEMLAHMATFVALRVRNEAAADRDPQLGRKFALGLFLHYSVLLVLGGLTVSACDLMDHALFPWQVRQAAGNAGPWPGGPPAPPPRFEPFSAQQRLAAALVLSGVLHGVGLFVLIRFGTNARRHPQVGRSFVYKRLVLGGGVVMAATTTFLILLLQEGEGDMKALSYVLGAAVVWGPVTVGHLFWVLAHSRRERAAVKPRVVEEADPD